MRPAGLPAVVSARRPKEQADLQDQIDELREALGQTESAGWKVDIAPAQRTILGLLLNRQSVTREAIFICLYAHKPECDRPDDDKLVDVHLSHLRKWLRANGVEIQTISHEGRWFLRREDRDKVRALLAEKSEEQMLERQAKSEGLDGTQRADILALLGGKDRFEIFGLPARESRVLAVLLCNGVVTKAMMRDAAFWTDTPPASWEAILGTYRLNVQKAIKALATIQNERGVGWSLEPREKIAIREVIEGKLPAPKQEGEPESEPDPEPETRPVEPPKPAEGLMYREPELPATPPASKRPAEIDMAINAIRAEIRSRERAKWELEKKLATLDGEIAGLREAEHRIERVGK